MIDALLAFLLVIAFTGLAAAILIALVWVAITLERIR